jgi:class 3 adenylate cyclase
MDWCEWFGFRFDPFFDKPLESDIEMERLLVIDKSMEEQISPLLRQMNKVPFLSLVIGDRGVGKSTFMYYSMNQALKSSYLPVYLGLDHIQLEFSKKPTFDIAAAVMYEFGAKLLDATLNLKRSFFLENRNLLENFARYLGLEFEETEGFVPSGKPYRLDFFEQKRYILTILNLLKSQQIPVLLSIDNLDKISKLEILKDFFTAPFAQTFFDDLKKGGVSILIAMDVPFSQIKKQNANLKYLAQDVQINPLSPTQAVELLTKRIKFSNDPQPKNPFANDAMISIGLSKKGVTRDILAEARNLCLRAYEQKISLISKEFADKGLVSFSESRAFYEILEKSENLRVSILKLCQLAADPTFGSKQIVHVIKDVMSGKKIVVSNEFLNALLDLDIIKSSANEKYILSQSISSLFEVVQKGGWDIDRFLDWIFGKESIHILSGEIPGINAQVSIDQFGPIPGISKATVDIIVGDIQQTMQTRMLHQEAISDLAQARRMMEKFRTLTWDDIDNVTTFKEINWSLMAFLTAFSKLYISCATSRIIRLKSLKPTDLVENALHHFQEEYGTSFKSFYRFQHLRANMNGLLRGGFSPSHSDVKAAFDDFQDILTEFTRIWQGISGNFPTLEAVDERHDSILKEVLELALLMGYSIERGEYRRFKINGEEYYRLGFLKFPLDETYVDTVREKRLKNRLSQDQSYFLICCVKPDSKSKATVKEVLAFTRKCNDLATIISGQSSAMPEGWPRYLFLYVSVSGFEPGIWAALRSTVRFPGSQMQIFDFNGLQNAKRQLTIGKRIPKEIVSEEELERLWAKDLEQLLRLRLNISEIIREKFEKTTTILLADMKDFTKRTSRDMLESAEAVQKLSDMLEKNVEKYNGVGTNTEGDSFIATFDRPELAALAALDSVMELDQYNQNVKEESRIYVRIGICIGDVLFKGDRPFIGDAVNTAARIMKEAEPNKVVTTEQTYKQISALRNFEFKNLGTKELKGVDKPLVIYEIQLKAISELNKPM